MNYLNKRLLPIILKYLDKENIEINIYNEAGNNILYTDEYQMVIEITGNLIMIIKYFVKVNLWSTNVSDPKRRD